MSDLSDLRRRVRQAISDHKQKAAERRASRDEASRAWDMALEQSVIPTVRDMAAVLAGEGLGFRLDTPGRTARLVADRNPDDYIELLLDTSDDVDSPEVIGRTVRGRGRQSVTVVEEPLGPPKEIAADRVIAFLSRAIAPWIK